MLQNVWQDVRYGLRGLITRPGFTIIAMLTLALGIGSAAAIFSVIQNVLLDPAPYADVDRIAYVQIRDASRSEQDGRTAFQLAEFLDYREQSQVFEDVIGGSFEDSLLTTKDGTFQFATGLVTPNTFRFLGVPPQLGRGIVDSDVEPGAPPVFVMSHKMWVAQYSMDPAVVGRVFVLNGVPTTCIGVMPPRFTKQGADLWKPMKLDRADPSMQRRYRRLPGQAETRCHIRARDRGDGHRGAPDCKALPGQLPAAVHSTRGELGRRPRPAVQDDAVHAVRGGGCAAPHCVHQRREHAARACRRAGKGDGDPHGAWSRALASRTPVAD